jgi:hypothetical protein
MQRFGGQWSRRTPGAQRRGLPACTRHFRVPLTFSEGSAWMRWLGVYYNFNHWMETTVNLRIF